MMLDPANGVAKGEGFCLLLQHVRSSAVEELGWKQPYIPVKIGVGAPSSRKM